MGFLRSIRPPSTHTTMKDLDIYSFYFTRYKVRTKKHWSPKENRKRF